MARSGATPSTFVTTTAAPTFTLTVTGTNPGSDNLRISATETGGSATASADVAMTVTPG